MKLFDVYNLFDVTPVKAYGTRLWDENGTEYLDLYGGHAVISVGHCHPRYVTAITAQLGKLGFYSNSVRNPLQEELAEKIGELSGYPDYSLFLCNSGAEANENALKLASFHTGERRVLAFKGAFHGRTSGAVAVTDNPKIRSPFNCWHEVTFVGMNDIEAVREELSKGDIAAVIIEGIQGVGGIIIPDDDFMRNLREVTCEAGVPLILDEVQSGCGRSGKYFAHQWAGIRPDIITMAKGMAADIIKDENLVQNALVVGDYLKSRLQALSDGAPASEDNATLGTRGGTGAERSEANGGAERSEASELPGAPSDTQPKIKEVRGRGLMLGVEFDGPVAEIRKKLLFDKHIFTGVSGKNMIRLLAPLVLSKEDVDIFIKALEEVL